MQIIVSRTKSFILGAEQVTVAPSPRLTTVPDWVAETGTFKLGLQDNSIQVLQPVAPPKPAAVPVPPADPPKMAAKGK